MNICQPKKENGTCNRYINGCETRKNMKVFIAASKGFSQFNIIIKANNIQLSKYVPKLANEVWTVNGNTKNNEVKKAIVTANTITFLYEIFVSNNSLFTKSLIILVIKFFNYLYATRSSKSSCASFIER